MIETQYTTDEAARLLGVTARRIRQLCVVFGERKGRDWLLTKSEIVAISKKIRKSSRLGIDTISAFGNTARVSKR
jgi:hypothetical protein